MNFMISEHQMLLLHSANKANMRGVISAVIDQVEKGLSVELIVAAALSAVLKAERDRVEDLFFTQRIYLPDEITANLRHEIDMCIKSDRMKLAMSVREGKSWSGILSEINSRFDAEFDQK